MSRIPAQIVKQLKARAAAEYDGEVALCEICGKVRGNSSHHRRNQSQGGRHILSNLMWLCGDGTTGCHGWVTENPAMAERNGWTIQGTQVQPWESPCRRRDESVLLDNEGGWKPVSSYPIPTRKEA